MILQTERAILTPLSKADFSEILSMYSEADSNKFIPPLLNKTEDYFIQFLEGKVKVNEHTVGFWTVRSKNNNEYIGTVNLNQFKDTSINHIGAHISKKFWNQGYAFELLKELMNYGFQVRKLDAIHGIVSEDHHVSKKLLNRLGIVFLKEYDIDGKIAHLHRKEA